MFYSYGQRFEMDNAQTIEVFDEIGRKAIPKKMIGLRAILRDFLA